MDTWYEIIGLMLLWTLLAGLYLWLIMVLVFGGLMKVFMGSWLEIRVASRRMRFINPETYDAEMRELRTLERRARRLMTDGTRALSAGMLVLILTALIVLSPST